MASMTDCISTIVVVINADIAAICASSSSVA
jgi:hypothetical protein